MRRRKQNSAHLKQLQLEWEAMLARHSSPLECGAKARNIKVKPRADNPSQKTSSEIKPSKDLTKLMGNAPKREPQRYTGTAIVGIATMHKSNLTPIFNTDAAKEVASMRR